MMSCPKTPHIYNKRNKSMGDGGEQNAPLGRAVTGGLIFATAATLFFVPTVFMLVNKMKRVGAQDVSAQTALG